MICNKQSAIVRDLPLRSKLINVFLAISLLLTICHPCFAIQLEQYDSVAKIIASRGLLTFYSSLAELPLRVVGKLVSDKRAAPSKSNDRQKGKQRCSEYLMNSFSLTTTVMRNDLSGPAAVLLSSFGNAGVIKGTLSNAPPGTREGPLACCVVLLMYFIVLSRSSLPAANCKSMERIL
jgi:hypothetical protein